jgi:hypothetical protein
MIDDAVVAAQRCPEIMAGTAVVMADGKILYAGPIKGLLDLSPHRADGARVMLNPVDWASLRDFANRKAN